jgi:aldose 1-epimerase
LPTTVKIEDFGVHPDGPAHKFTLTNAKGNIVELTDIGAAVCSIVVPDKNGTPTDVALFHDTFEAAVTNNGHMGAICGRIAGRVFNGEFKLNGKTYTVAKKQHSKYSLHGGIVGFSLKLWGHEVTDGAVTFRLVSPDGDQGYPGTLTVEVKYSWTDDDRLTLDYSAATDADTIVNLTNHVYFNLNGHADGKITGHTATLFCDKYLPMTPDMIPNGELREVAGTNMDFTTPRTFGERIDNDDEQLKIVSGYDFSFALRDGEGVKLCARVIGEKTGITVDTYTDRQGVHLYTGNNMSPTVGKGGAEYDKRCGFCLETQNFPDAINQPNFPSPVLRKGDEYRNRTVYAFYT